MSLKLSSLKKLRCRFLDQKSNKPVKGVIASLSVVFGDNPNLINLPIATLSSDATGYMSFDLKAVIEMNIPVHSCLLTAPKYGIDNYDLFSPIKQTTDTKNPIQKNLENLQTQMRRMFEGSDQQDEGSPKPYPEKNKKKPLCILFPVYVDITKEKKDDCKCSDSEKQTLPSVQNPDTCDYELSPFSFVTPTAIKTGNGSCESITPSLLPLQQYHFYKIVVRGNDTNTASTDSGTEGTYSTHMESFIGSAGIAVPIDITSALPPPSVPKIKFCEILDYKQSWYSFGHSLGEIKYSLPLAPGESTQLAVIEWNRQDTASRKDGITATEFLDHDSRRDRSIEDTVNAALRENQDGWSMMGGTSAAATIPIGGVPVSMNAAYGGSVSHSSGNRDVEGDSLQDLHDRVRQTSAYIRSLTSTVIVQSSQAESNTVQTRRVANHNHCHAMTIQYYEVLRHYSLKTEYKGKRNAVLIPFSIFKFTNDIALRFRQAIEPVLLDATVKGGFEALLRQQMPELYPVRSNTIILNGKSSNDTNETATGVFVKTGDTILIKAVGEISYWVPEADKEVTFFGPDGSTALPQPIDTQEWSAGKNVRMFSLCFKIGNGNWQQGGKDISTIADADGEIFVVANDVKKTFGDNTGKWVVNVTAATNGVAQQGLNVNTGKGVNASNKETIQTSSLTYTLAKDPILDNAIRNIEGITVKEGDLLTIRASGEMIFVSNESIKTNPDGLGENVREKKIASTPSGASNSKFAAEGLTAYSLCYRIGDFTDSRTGWRQAGTEIKNIKIEKGNGGKISFIANDNQYGDNVGSWQIGVEVTTPGSQEVVAPIINDPTAANEANSGIEPGVKDKLLSLRLLNHLNSNQGYYNRMVWMRMDAVERRLYLEAALSGMQKILDLMDDMPLAVSGNYLAFACDVPDEVAVQGSVEKTHPGETTESIVCFPTRGLFAEAQLGHCNSCEERDITRMWDWNEMTTETPPDISGISPGPKGTSTDLTPTQLPGNVIQITQPQNAPDPTGFANALTLLGNGNAFRDMSGLNQVSGLLGQLVKQSGEAHIRKMAIDAKEKVDGMKNGSGSSKNGSAIQNERTPPTKEWDEYTQKSKIADRLGFNKEQKAQFVLGSSSTSTSPGKKPTVKPHYWADLVKFQIPESIEIAVNKRDLKVQSIEEGRGPVNLDYYEVNIQTLPFKPGSSSERFSAKDFFDYIRINFADFMRPFFRTSKPKSLEPYEDIDESKWTSDDPLETVMLFTIDPNPAPILAGILFPPIGSTIPEYALVVCSEYSSDTRNEDYYWNFTTLQGTGIYGIHPVSGTRQFGLRSLNNQLLFYVRAADRVTGPIEDTVNSFGENVFNGGDQYWKYFLTELVKFITENKGEAGSFDWRDTYDWKDLLDELSNNVIEI